MIAKDIITLLTGKLNSSRENIIKENLLRENIPKFLFDLKPIEIKKGNDVLIYYVMPDYICLGEDSDFIHIPMTPPTIKEWMVNHDFCLPTKKMVDQIYNQSIVKIRPITWDSLYKNSEHKFNRDSTKCYTDQSLAVQNLFKSFQKPLGTLTAGHKKDVVLSNALLKHPKNVAIYGWFKKDGTVIQGLNASDHSINYVDYSHGLRMVSKNCLLNGNNVGIEEIFDDPNLCIMIHDEILEFKSY